MTATRDMMLGPGGKMRRPRSEGHVLERNIQTLKELLEMQPGNHALQNVIRDLMQLHSQVSAGYHANPYTPFRIVGEIGKDVHSIAYQHKKDGKLYKHDFKKGSAQAIAVERHGKREILITGDVPLWDEF